MGSEELTRSVQCVACKKVLDVSCVGHRKGELCVNFEEREDRKRGREQGLDKTIQTNPRV